MQSPTPLTASPPALAGRFRRVIAGLRELAGLLKEAFTCGVRHLLHRWGDALWAAAQGGLRWLAAIPLPGGARRPHCSPATAALRL